MNFDSIIQTLIAKINLGDSPTSRVKLGVPYIFSPKGSTKLVAIDGRGGSGKSTLAKQLSELSEKSSESKFKIISTDSFPYSPEIIPWNEYGTQTRIDSKRLKEEVLLPLIQGNDVCYRVNSWWKDQIINKEEFVKSGGTVIVEGCYSLLKELRDLYDYKIWIESSVENSLENAIKRDGESSREVWTKCYLPNESSYILSHSPQKIADIILHG